MPAVSNENSKLLSVIHSQKQQWIQGWYIEGTTATRNGSAGGIVGAWGIPSSHSYSNCAHLYLLCAIDLHAQ